MSESKLITSSDSINDEDQKVSEALKLSIDINPPQNEDRDNLINMLEKLNEKKEELMTKNKMLSAALGHYYAQKKIAKAFHQLTDVEVLKYTENYHNTLENLWKHKNKMNQLKNNYEEKSAEVMKELDGEIKEKNELKNDLKTTIQTKAIELETAGVPITEKLILRLFNHFEKVHSEISGTRLEFIKTHGELAEIKEKDDELDNLGDGYRVLEYENLKTELQTISSNIDSRNEELEKLRMRYSSNVEKSEHFKKSREKLEKKIEQVGRKFSEKRSEEQQMRWQVNSLRKQKDLMRLELDKLLQKSQLLTKIPLLRNFDSMSDGIENVNQEIATIENKKSQIFKKISSMESKVSNLESHEADLKDLDAFIAHEREKLKKYFMPKCDKVVKISLNKISIKN